MSDHIRLFLNLKHYITEADHKLKNILVIHGILHSFPCFNIWDVVKQNLFDKEKDLTLDILTIELISIYKYSKCNCLANKKDKKAKFDQIAFFTKSLSSSNNSRKKRKKVKNLDKKKKSQTRYYKSPKQEKVSRTFEYLVQNLKVYNRVKI